MDIPVTVECEEKWRGVDTGQDILYLENTLFYYFIFLAFCLQLHSIKNVHDESPSDKQILLSSSTQLLS